ncbi:MAG: Rpn family recombination-promoting nuclease/putative transposase [Oscillospiraceae bacterium]|nr:Rpn family recombination-promoting nuclease/putative transposase [Oscillospiraceae bacterium]
MIDFLNNILANKNESIVDLTVVNNEMPVESNRRKKSRFDIRTIFGNGEQALVEMEFKLKDNFHRRSLHNVSRLYSSQAINRLDYRSLKKSYMVGVMGYNLLDEGFGYHNTFSFRDNQGRELSDDMQIIYLELEKTAHLLDKPAEELTNAECWALFLKYASYNDKQSVLEKISKKNGGVRMAIDVLKYISKSEMERMAYEDEILAEIDQEAEFDYRLKNEKIEMAKEMLLEGEPIDKIIKYSKLTKEEIENLM